MPRRIVLLLVLMLMLACSTETQALPTLYGWAFNQDGMLYSSDIHRPADLGSSFEIDGFNWDNGLGSMTISFTSAGEHSFTSFFDHEIVQNWNTYYNEYGKAYGTPSPGQSWEIDEPGWWYGDIYENTVAGELDNTNGVPEGLEDDVSMALDWDFTLQKDEVALITLSLTECLPDNFSLAHYDPEDSLYFSGSLNIESNISPVPEPSSVVLMGAGLIALSWVSRRKGANKLNYQISESSRRGFSGIKFSKKKG